MQDQPPKKATPPRKNQLRDLSQKWSRFLRMDGKSANTIDNYIRSLNLLAAYLDEHGLPATVKGVKGEHIQDWLASIQDRSSANWAAHHYRNISVFFATWLTKKEKMLAPQKNPMLDVTPPKKTPVARPALSEADAAALLQTCSGRSFTDRRDTAIIRIFIDTGVRVSGLVGMLYHPDYPALNNRMRNDVFLDEPIPLIRFRLKGGNPHFVDIGKKAAVALDRYLRMRAAHKDADSPALWVGTRGAIGRQGIQQMLHARGEEAGVQGRVHPHRFRRTMATWHLDNGGSREALKARAGWRSDSMVNLYVSDSEQRRAWAESQQLGLGDRI